MGVVFFVGFAIIGIILISLFIIGMVFLIIGIVQKRKPQYAGKKSPTVCIASGTICLLPPILGALYLAYFLVSYFGEIRAKTETVEGAIDGLLTAADAGDRDSFEKIFTPNLQKKENFGKAVDAFFESYPNGLSLCAREARYGTEGGSAERAWTTVSFTCFLDGEWYYMHLNICYKNKKSPDDFGVEFFCIENLEANALDLDHNRGEFLACRIADESEVTARLIDGRGYVFTPTPDRSITVEQMKSYLEQYDDFYDLTAQIGRSNACRWGYAYYYELVPENGEPRYACVETEGREIFYSYICSDVGKISDQE